MVDNWILKKKKKPDIHTTDLHYNNDKLSRSTTGSERSLVNRQPRNQEK